METKTITWDDLRVGDEFPDHAVVTDIKDWYLSDCYAIQLKYEEPLIVSKDHMIKTLVLENDPEKSNKDERILNDQLSNSMLERQKLNEVSNLWLTVEDIYNSINTGKLVVVLGKDYNRDTLESNIENIVPLKQQKNVRCITTSTGQYIINGITSHNSSKVYSMKEAETLGDYTAPVKMDDGRIIYYGHAKLEQVMGHKINNVDDLEKESSKDPKLAAKVAQIGFKASTHFSLPVAHMDDNDKQAAGMMYAFQDLPSLGVVGKQNNIDSIFDKVGTVDTYKGQEYEIKHNFSTGLTARDVFNKSYSARLGQRHKSNDVSAPGDELRRLNYGLSDVRIAKGDCGAHDVLKCKSENGVCEGCIKRLHKQNNGKDSNNSFRSGDMIASRASSALMEPIYQSYLSAIHRSGDEQEAMPGEVVTNTFKAYASSPIIQAANDRSKVKTLGEQRQVLFEGLKKSYEAAGAGVSDDYIKLAVRQMTKTRGKDRIVEGNDNQPPADIKSVTALSAESNVIKKAALERAFANITSTEGSQYDNVTRTIEWDAKDPINFQLGLGFLDNKDDNKLKDS